MSMRSLLVKRRLFVTLVLLCIIFANIIFSAVSLVNGVVQQLIARRTIDWPALTFTLITISFLAMSTILFIRSLLYFLILQKLGISNAVWFYDLTMSIIVFMLLFMAARSIFDIPIRESIFPFSVYLIIAYAVNFLWILFRWFIEIKAKSAIINYFNWEVMLLYLATSLAMLFVVASLDEYSTLGTGLLGLVILVSIALEIICLARDSKTIERLLLEKEQHPTPAASPPSST